MNDKFDSFVVFAEMRTGSNFLEANLNAFAGIACHGEAFNPFFMGYPKSEPILGVDQATALERISGPSNSATIADEDLDLTFHGDKRATERYFAKLGECSKP